MVPLLILAIKGFYEVGKYLLNVINKKDTSDVLGQKIFIDDWEQVYIRRVWTATNTMKITKSQFKK